MTRIIYISALFVLVVFFIPACKKDFLETQPLSEFTESNVWSDPVLAQTFLNNVYSSLDDYIANSPMTASFTDEAHDRKGYFNFNNCLITADNIPDYGGSYGGHLMLWNEIYKNIRACNLFLEKADHIKFDTTSANGKLLKESMTGEAHFLRASLYFNLINLYGGVPLVTTPYELTDTFQVKRDTYADCVTFISNECDQAANLLPLEQSGNNVGRATKGAALALKARVLLYAASDLHNTQVFSGYSNPELIGYTDGNKTARWQAAKDAAAAVMNLGVYSLYKPEPASPEEASKNYEDLFLSRPPTQEDIFMRFYTAKSFTNNSVLINGPNGFHTFGHNTPAGNLVDDYEMTDGSPFSWNNPTEAAEPYKNRDPRFFATILYEGAHWRERPQDAIALDPNGVIQVGIWQKWDNAASKMSEVWGLDTRNSPFQNWNASWTGYYLRKLIDPAIDGQFAGSDVPCRFYRYGEVLLNYAEACIELGQDDEARKYINMVRKRAGMPDVTESGEALRLRYRHERRIEMAYEDQRFWDIRRWVIGPKGYADATGVTVVYKLNPDHTTATIPTVTSQLVQERTWDDKAYFFPILRDELNRNKLLIQNPGY
ncbi:RagB/SusD family nutrient uptake outer membrane protein [Segetibacter koreensis]|uniref:RagB/SusD family nutrient uptake outer membrane protein n=1 Tax=Segetibacter koreensis TaxID=398037 RepID=UPI0003673219|nr:RagB/SusD family nutrient uptake outer membrane protein [Segetibacter koreensis]